ncbi:MAG: CARDB domain-containing protein, partial [Planctomycetota bacterium]
RIGEDRISNDGGGTASAPEFRLFDGDASVTPFNLSDVVNFGYNGEELILVNPSTGGVSGAVGNLTNVPLIRDIAFRRNGTLYGFTESGGTDASTDYVRISTEDSTRTDLGGHGLETYELATDGAGNIIFDPNTGLPQTIRSDVGFDIEALTIVSDNRGYFVGNRPRLGPGNDYFENILYAYDPETGNADSLVDGDRTTRRITITVQNNDGTFTTQEVDVDIRHEGAGTQVRERGFIRTGTPGNNPNPALPRLNTVPSVEVAPDGTTVQRINDGDSFVVTDGINRFQFDMDGGPIFAIGYDANTSMRISDGETFSVTTVAGTSTFEFNTGPTIEVGGTANDPVDVLISGPVGGFSEHRTRENLLIQREDVSASPVYLRLTSSHPQRVMVPHHVTVPGSAMRLSVPIEIVDDDLVQSSVTEVTITAQRLDVISQQSMDAEPIELTMPLRDNDTPGIEINLGRDVVPEGHAVQGVVHRNYASDLPLVVQLSSSDAYQVDFPVAQITIPAGESSVMFDIVGVEDQITDGTQTTVIHAIAQSSDQGQLQATAALHVSDQDLPDLRADWIDVPAVAASDTNIAIRFAIRNDGPVDSPTGAQQQILLRDLSSGDDILLHSSTLAESIAAGSSIQTTVNVRVPRQFGEYRLIVVADAFDSVHEIVESNNTIAAATNTQILAAYTANATVDQNAAPADTPISIRGNARVLGTENPAADVEVHIRVAVDGTQRTLAAFTDHQGNFETVFHPLPGESGVYQVAAHHPGANAVTAQDTFTLIGLRHTPQTKPVVAGEAETTSVRIQITNPSDQTITGLDAVIESGMPNISLNATIESNSLAAGESTHLVLDLHPDNAKIIDGNLQIDVLSDNASPLSVTVPVSVQSLRSRLTLQSGDLHAAIVRNRQTVLPIVVQNVGGIEAKNVQLQLPTGLDWVRPLANPDHTLAAGDSQTIELLFAPPADANLTRYAGELVVTADDSHFRIPFEIDLRSDAAAELTVRVVDEYFYFAEDKPLVSG